MILLKDENYRQRGFTLIELMLVVAIISALGALVVPRFTVSQEAARTARVQADLRTIETAIVMYEADVGSLPTDIGDLSSYLKTLPVAPAGTVRVNATGTVEADHPNDPLSYGIESGRAVFYAGNAAYLLEHIR